MYEIRRKSSLHFSRFELKLISRNFLVCLSYSHYEIKSIGLNRESIKYSNLSLAREKLIIPTLNFFFVVKKLIIYFTKGSPNLNTFKFKMINIYLK